MRFKVRQNNSSENLAAQKLATQREQVDHISSAIQGGVFTFRARSADHVDRQIS
jgi:hypothetical protein